MAPDRNLDLWRGEGQAANEKGTEQNGAHEGMGGQRHAAGNSLKCVVPQEGIEDAAGENATGQIRKHGRLVGQRHAAGNSLKCVVPQRGGGREDLLGNMTEGAELGKGKETERDASGGKRI